MGEGASPARDEVEEPEEADPLQLSLDVLAARVGGQADPQARGPRVRDEGEHPRQDGLGLVSGPVERPPLGLERGAVRARPERPPGVEGVVRVADASHEQVPVEGDAAGAVHVAVRVDQRRLGVEDQSVKIEDKGPYHALWTATFSLRRGRGKR